MPIGSLEVRARVRDVAEELDFGLGRGRVDCQVQFIFQLLAVWAATDDPTSGMWVIKMNQRVDQIRYSFLRCDLSDVNTLVGSLG